MRNKIRTGDGELGASLRYLSQRYSMPYAELKGLLTDIGTEELAHLEMIGAIVHQLTRNFKVMMKLKKERLLTPTLSTIRLVFILLLLPACRIQLPICRVKAT